MALTTLFVDLNSYFATAEQQLNPRLRGRPIGVVPVEAESTCCIAASIEAKRYGVKTGTLVREARRLCPEIVFIRARHRLYVEMHHAIVKAVESCVPVSGVYSIDEMACRLLGSERQRENAVALAVRIKAAIQEQAGEWLRCSVWIAPNVLLAKTATDMEKPDGLVVIDREDLPRAIAGLGLRDFPGIGAQMHKRLEAAGIRTALELYAQPKKRLREIWGSVVGEWWWHGLHGDELAARPVRTRSMGHEHVLPPKFRTEEGSWAMAVRLLCKAGARMRASGYRARALMVSVRSEEGEKWKAGVLLGDGCADTLEMIGAMERIWRDRPRPRPPQARWTPMKVGVVLSELVASGQGSLSLFVEENRRDALSKAVDALNQRHGAHTVFVASMMDVREEATGGIAFGNVPDLGLADSVGQGKGRERPASDRVRQIIC